MELNWNFKDKRPRLNGNRLAAFENIDKDVSRVLVIGDLHEPCCRDGYLEFCLGIKKKYKTNRTVFIGDVLDHSVISFHERHPNAPGQSGSMS